MKLEIQLVGLTRVLRLSRVQYSSLVPVIKYTQDNLRHQQYQLLHLLLVQLRNQLDET